MFHATRFLADHFETVEGVIALIDKHASGATPSPEAVRKWFIRGAIPGDWLGLMLIALERQNGAPVSLLPYHAI